jgi:hypothetical protein
MPQHWRGQAVFWYMTGNDQCCAAACCHLYWRGRRMQHLRFCEWPAWYSEPRRMWHCVGPRRLFELKPKIPKSLKTPGNMRHNTVRSRNKTLRLAAGTWLQNDDKWPMTITTQKWDTTNLLNIHIYMMLQTLVASCDMHKQHILFAGCCLVAWSTPEDE